MNAILERGCCDHRDLEPLAERAARELSATEKRRFIYNLAQLFQSKGSLSDKEYEAILDLAEKIGVPDTQADSIIHSVYNINITFTAIMGLLAMVAILYFGAVVIVPLVIAIFITMIINKVESGIAKTLSLSRFRLLTKLGAMVLILGVLFGLIMAAVVSGKDIATRLPHYEAKIGTTLEQSAVAQEVLAWLQEKGVLAQLKQIPFGRTVSNFLGSLITLLGYFVLVVIFTGFLVFSSSSFTGILQEMNDKIGAYIGIKTLICLLTGLLAYGLCVIFGIDFALFWAVLAFLLNYIPTVGAIIATLPPILLAMIQLDSWPLIVLFVVLFTVPQVILGQVLEPIFWGLLWGIPGMFLATPLMALLRILSSYFNFSRPFERLLAADRA
jgi:predicted PurR-regulated permease PerM